MKKEVLAHGKVRCLHPAVGHGDDLMQILGVFDQGDLAVSTGGHATIAVPEPGIVQAAFDVVVHSAS